MFSFWFIFSLRKSVSRPQVHWRRCWSTVCHEGSGESQHRPETENDRTHQNRKAGSGDDQKFAVPGN